MDERDFTALNKYIEMDFNITHPLQIVSFAHIDAETRDLFTYYFQVENAKIRLHSIDAYRSNGKKGNTYKHEEIFHFEYKKTITNYSSGLFEQPEVPDEIWKSVGCYLKGFLVNSL